MEIYNNIDWCGESGAKSIANKIREYWAKRGKEVKILLERGPVAGRGKPLWCVRSDMVGGLPIGESEELAP
jgi:hypothetical protein